MLRLAELLGPSCFIMPRFTSFNVLDWWYCRNENRAWNPHRMGKVHLMWPKWILNFFIRSLYKHLMLLKKKTSTTFFFISKVLEMRNTSVAIRRSFWALTSNWITCTSSSVKTLRYQLPAEEICHGATSINLCCHILSVGLNSINSWAIQLLQVKHKGRGCQAEAFAAQKQVCASHPHFYWALSTGLYFLTLYRDRAVL